MTSTTTLRLVLALARYRPRLYLLGAAGITTFYLLPLVPGLILRRFFDLLSGSAPATISVPAAGGDLLPAAWTLAALFLAWGVVRIAQLLAGWYGEMSSNLLHSALMQRNLLERTLQLPGARAVPYSPGEAVSRFRDDVKAVARFTTWAVDPLGQALLAGIALWVLVRVDALITVAVFVPLLAMVMVVNVATNRIRTYRRANQEAIGGVTDLLGEIFGAVQAVKVAGAEERVVAHLRERNEARRRATIRDVVFTRLLGSISFNAANLGTGLVLLLAAQALQGGRLTVGDFALFLSYLNHLTQMTGLFAELATQIRQIDVSLDRLNVLLQGAPPQTLVAHHPLDAPAPAPLPRNA